MKSLSKTPAPPKDRISGSKVNPKGSASSEASASKIKLDAKTLTALTNKLKEFKEANPNSKNITLADLKAVYRRGAGAYSTSHRPTISGGKANSRNAWAMARVNKFLLKAGGTKVKKAYVQDDDLMKMHLGGDMSKHLAPNGKPSNLNHEQWHLVRTPEFKAWFGDWENEPENASKVVDENGEPLVVYRGMPKKRRVGNIFRTNVNLFGTKGVGGRATNDFAFYFTDMKEVAEEYGKNLTEEEGEYVVKSYFLNIRNLFKAFEYKNQYEINFKSLYDLANNTGEKIYLRNHLNNIVYGWNFEKRKNEPKEYYQYNNSFEHKYNYSGQVPNTEKTFTFFVDWNKKYDSNQDFWRSYLNYSLKYDGLVFYEITHNSNWNDDFTKASPMYGDEFSKTYGVFEPNNIKLADGTNTTFDSENLDIRYDVGGELDKHKETYQKWKNLVNMSKSELEKFYNSEEGKKAGLSSGEAKEQGIDSGRESARWIMKMKDTPVSEWTPAMWKWAKKQISFISRMSGNKGGLYDDKGRKTRKHTSLLIWGHNPEKKCCGGIMERGGLIAPNGRKSNLTPEQYELVRTPEFKEWFGDWEKVQKAKLKDPSIDEVTLEYLSKDVSKVVDENGEPLLCFHGTNSEFYEFDKRSIGMRNDEGFYGKGFYFTFQKNSKDIQYAVGEALYYGKTLLTCFIDIKNPFIFAELKKYEGQSINLYGVSSYVFLLNLVTTFPELGEVIKIKKVTWNNNGEGDISYLNAGILVELFAKYKSELKTYISHDSVNEVKRINGYVKSKMVEYDLPSGEKRVYENRDNLADFVIQKTDENGNILIPNMKEVEISLIVEAMKKYDGIDIDYHPEGFVTRYPEITDAIKNSGHDGILQNETGDELVVFESTQIKLADGTNTTFDGNNPDIRYKDGGKTKNKKEMEFNDIILYYEDKGNFMIPKGLFYAWLYDEKGVSKKFETEEYDYVMFPIGGGLGAFSQKGYVPPLLRIWTKKYQKDKKGIEHLMGIVQGRYDEKNKKMYVEMMTTNPKFRRMGINSYIIKKLREIFEVEQDDVIFDSPTEQGTKFMESKRYEDGGTIFANINEKLKNLGFVKNVQNRYGKDMDENNYVTAFYDKNKGIYSIRGIHKYKGALGENSIGIKHDFDNENDFFQKIFSYMKSEQYDTGGYFKSNKTIEEIAKEKNVPLSYAKKQLEIGMKVESEHSNFKHIQKTIALQHLDESINYYEKLNEMEQQFMRDGGSLKYDSKGVKDYFAHGSGNAGGVLVGKRHSEGGIKAINKSTGQPLEMEGGEVVITRKAVSDNTKREFEGQMLTNKEILSKINESGGGVKIFGDGGNIEHETCSCSGKSYKYGGRMMSDYDIAKQMAKFDKQEYYRSLSDKSYNEGGELEIDDMNPTEMYVLGKLDRNIHSKCDIDRSKLKDISYLVSKGLVYTVHKKNSDCHEVRLTDYGKSVLESIEVPEGYFAKGGLMADCGCKHKSYRDGGGVDDSKTYFKGLDYEYKNQFELNKAIEELISTKQADTITPEEKSFIQYFSGYGGLEKFGATGKGLLYEYFTPSEIAKKMWGLAYKYGFKGGSVLEPSCGIGEFIKYAPEQTMVTGYEINEVSAKICRILYPQANIQSKYFETLFIKNNSSVRNNLQGVKKYELIIGNPPYGTMGGIYAGMGEKSYTKANNYIDYFILRGLDILQKDGLLIYIIGTEVASGGTPFLMQGMNPVKKSIIEKADLVDAYRLPNGVFERTDVLTDIVVFKKK